jgi:hypothetical protein
MKVQVIALIMKYMSITAVGVCFLLIINRMADEIFGINFIAKLNNKYFKQNNDNLHKSTSNQCAIVNQNKYNVLQPDKEGLGKRKPLQLLGKVVCLCLLNRMILFIGTYLFFKVQGNSNLDFYSSFKEIWFKWDSNGYLRIAEGWYKNVGDIKFDIALYPFYPILIKIANFFIHDYFISGIFVSNIFLIIGLYFLFRLIESEYNKSDLAFDSIQYVLIFPMSFFFSIVYTESVFFALSVLTVYYVHKKQWIAGGIFGMLAAFSRNQGILLSIVLLFELLHENRLVDYLKQGNMKKFTIRFLHTVGITLLVPCGTFLYLLTNKLSYGNWFQFLAFQNENWSQRFGFFADNIKNFVFEAVNRDARLSLGVFVPNILIFFVSLALIVLVMNKMRLSYIIYTFAYVIISFSPTWLLSGPRYISGLFTFYLMLALVIRGSETRKHVGFVFYVLLLFYSFEFFLGNVY